MLSALLFAIAVNAIDVPPDFACVPYGDDFAFWVVPPEGWSCACHAEQTHGVAVALWPKNGAWPSSPALMYVAVSTKDEDTMEKLIAHDLEKFKTRNPDGIVQVGNELKDAKGEALPVRLTSGLKSGRFEAIAYAEQPHAFLLFGLTAKSKADLEAAMPAFSQLVRSYFMINDIRFNQPKK